VLSIHAANINIIEFGLARSGPESAIDPTQGEHAKHYTADTGV